MIEILTRQPIGTIYDVETTLTTDFVHDVHFHNGREQLLSTMALVSGVEKFHLEIRKSNNVEYIVAVIMVKKENDDTFLWNHIELAFADVCGEEV